MDKQNTNRLTDPESRPVAAWGGGGGMGEAGEWEKSVGMSGVPVLVL